MFREKPIHASNSKYLPYLFTSGNSAKPVSQSLNVRPAPVGLAVVTNERDELRRLQLILCTLTPFISSFSMIAALFSVVLSFLNGSL